MVIMDRKNRKHEIQIGEKLEKSINDHGKSMQNRVSQIENKLDIIEKKLYKHAKILKIQDLFYKN